MKHFRQSALSFPAHGATHRKKNCLCHPRQSTLLSPTSRKYRRKKICRLTGKRAGAAAPTSSEALGDRSERAVANNNVFHRRENDFQIQCDTSRADVSQVPGQDLAPIEQPAAIDLSQAGDAG